MIAISNFLLKELLAHARERGRKSQIDRQTYIHTDRQTDRNGASETVKVPEEK